MKILEDTIRELNLKCTALKNKFSDYLTNKRK